MEGNAKKQEPQPTHELSQPLQARVDAATAAKAEAQARTAEANAQSAEIKAASDAVTARLTFAKSFVPDLGAVKPSTLDVKASSPSFGSRLSFAALREIAARIASDVREELPDRAVVLVTSDLDLATADATYVEVANSLESLLESARQVLRDLEPHAGRAPGQEEMLNLTGGKVLKTAAGALTGLAAGAVAGGPAAPLVLAGEATAAVLPGLLSLLGTDRTLLTGTISASDVATSAAVAGALKANRREITVIHDDFRLLPTAGVILRANELATCRVRLTTLQLGLTNAKSEADKELAELQAAKHPDERKIADATEASALATARLQVVQTLAATIDAFTTTIHATPTGATRSPLATAALHEGLHGADRRFKYVLFASASPGDADEEITHHRILLWKDDELSCVADITVTYMLLETEESALVRAGSVTGTVQAHGTVGTKLTVEQPHVVE